MTPSIGMPTPDGRRLRAPAGSVAAIAARTRRGLAHPEQVAEWIEARIIELGGTRQLRAIADGEWVQIGDADDLARLFGEHVVVACRGHSIYTDVYHPDQHIALFVEAVGPDVCNDR